MVTTIGRVLPFVTAIKIKSNDQVDFQARIKRSKSLAAVLHVRMQWAGPVFGWVKLMKPIAHQDKDQEIKLCFSSKSSDQSRFCGPKHFNRGHKW